MAAPGDSKPTENQSVYFVSLGCPKNRVDSEVMLGAAQARGYRVVDDPLGADIMVVNTCGFIEDAREESVDTILELAEKRDGGRRKLVVTGCLSQRYPDDLSKEIPEIDALLGSADYKNFGATLDGLGAPARAGRKSLPVVQVSSTPSYIYDHDAPRLVTGLGHSVYVKIAEGCDRPCAFCIIPKLRGPQRSRSIESIALECEALAARGAKEVNLVAQDLTRYGVDLEDKPTLAALLRRLDEVEALRWIRLHYTYPSAFSDDLIEVIGNAKRVVPYIDVPLQHIDDDVLKKMRRGHSSRVIRGLVDRLRTAVPDLVLRTTFIAGHPGETESAFAKLKDFIRETEFDRVGVFAFSPEDGTHSATLADVVPPDVGAARRDELMALQHGISTKKLAAHVGRRLDILVDGPSEDSELVMAGRFYGQAPGIDGLVYLQETDAKAGDIVSAEVVDSTAYDLLVRPVSSQEQAA